MTVKDTKNERASLYEYVYILLQLLLFSFLSNYLQIAFIGSTNFFISINALKLNKNNIQNTWPICVWEFGFEFKALHEVELCFFKEMINQGSKVLVK